MKFHWRYILLMSFSLLLSTQVRAQYENSLDDDVKVWTGMHVNKEIGDNFTFSTKISYHTTSLLYSARFSDIGFKYRLPHNFRLAAFYRFVRFFEAEQMRFYTELEHRYHIKHTGIQLRSRIRWQNKRNTYDDYLEQHVRPLVGISYKRPKWILTPYASSELFFCYKPAILINRYRFTSGLRYDLNDMSGIRFFYRYQKELNTYSENDVTNHHTFNLSYRFHF